MCGRYLIVELSGSSRAGGLVCGRYLIVELSGSSTVVEQEVWCVGDILLWSCLVVMQW